VYSAAFIFEPGEYDAEFHRLNALIDAVAQANPGYLGRESWQAVEGTRRNVTYYWRDLDSLHAFSRDPAHLEAKRQYARWYRGYHIVIAEVLRAYGDGAFTHVVPIDRSRKGA
jgi:heme-degrading monooxygenase HmoA